MSVITALVSQNTQGVEGIHATPPEFVAQQVQYRPLHFSYLLAQTHAHMQIQCVLDDIPVQAIKTGMLTDEPTLRAVLSTLKSIYSKPGSMPPLVVDPVMVSTSGHSLLESSANALIRSELIPLATIVTPNIPEAELILGLEAGSVKTVDDMKRAAESIGKLGARAVLVKGGHCNLSSADVVASVKDDVYVRWDAGCGPDQPAILRIDRPDVTPAEEDVVVDVLYLPDPRMDGVAPFTLLVRPRLDTSSTHGTGCTLAAALTCAFAQGLSRKS